MYMVFLDKMRLLTKLKRFGKLYTFTHTTKTTPANQSDFDKAYKGQTKTTTTFSELAFIRPARAYAIHSDQQKFQREGGVEMTGIVNIITMATTAVVVDDTVTTPNGVYDIVAKEDFDELFIFEAHRQ